MDQHCFDADPDPDPARTFSAILTKDNKGIVTPDLTCASFIGCCLRVGENVPTQHKKVAQWGTRSGNPVKDSSFSDPTLLRMTGLHCRQKNTRIIINY